ncbi:MAG: aldehyde dehydrogenase family protein, partial [Bacteroidetes bacterium]|nr:aldehyde dehydrogenase family protein [Bacteroidota bacterium]
MSNGFFKVPIAVNEPVKQYAPNSPETALLKEALAWVNNNMVDVPMYIGSKEIRDGKRIEITPPHNHKKVIGCFYKSEKQHITQAIDAALAAREAWANMPWQNRAAIFLKAADLLTGPYRYKMNAATMAGQSKNCFQAEIDSACELIDF